MTSDLLGASAPQGALHATPYAPRRAIFLHPYATSPATAAATAIIGWKQAATTADTASAHFAAFFIQFDFRLVSIFASPFLKRPSWVALFA